MKRQLIYVVLTTLMFSACAVTKRQDLIIGEYSGQTPRMGSFVPRGNMNLSIFSKGIFEINWLDVTYSGTWELADRTRILLKFNDLTDPTILLRSGIISDREKEIQFINKNEIKFDNYILKRLK